MTFTSHVQLDEHVAGAMRGGGAVVALESAVITCGLPRPRNLEAARLMLAAVRGAGATPAIVAVVDGRLRVGLSDREVEALALGGCCAKVSSADLAGALTSGATAGTTVAATLVACRLAGIEVFATGGIGGVHRGWTARPDVSADLAELARTPCAVVCAGAKSLLDVAATLEVLEAMGVAVIGYRTDAFPLFLSAGTNGLAAPYRLDDCAAVARLCRCRWHDLGQQRAVLVAQPPPGLLALPADEVQTALEAALAAAEARGVRGPALTPFILGDLAERTGGRSIAANLGLLEANAALAAELAVALAERLRSPARRMERPPPPADVT